jgi:hypothetical protein
VARRVLIFIRAIAEVSFFLLLFDAKYNSCEYSEDQQVALCARFYYVIKIFERSGGECRMSPCGLGAHEPAHSTMLTQMFLLYIIDVNAVNHLNIGIYHLETTPKACSLFWIQPQVLLSPDQSLESSLLLILIPWHYVEPVERIASVLYATPNTSTATMHQLMLLCPDVEAPGKIRRPSERSSSRTVLGVLGFSGTLSV